MSLNEALEVTKIYSVSSMLPGDRSLIRLRPFCAPPHTISQAGLVGDGSKIRPGEIARAHRGVLFLSLHCQVNYGYTRRSFPASGFGAALLHCYSNPI